MSELRVDNIVSQDGSAAPNYSKGIRVAAGQTMTVEGDYSANGTSTFGGTATFNGPVNIGDINSTGVVTTTALHLGAEGSAVRVTSNTISGPAEMFIDPSAVGDNTGTVRIKGDFIVDGTTTTVNSTTVEIADKVIGVGTTCNTDILTDGAGIGIGSDKTFLYEHNSGTNPSLKSSENLNVPTGKGYQVDQTEVLNATTLGSSVVNSSLTSLGTLGSINATGISTIGNLKISAGIVTAVSGIVTFYGDGQYLTGAGVPGVSTTGTSSFTNLNVSGVSTFAGNINANGNIVGDNSTNISGINNITVSGISSASAFADFDYLQAPFGSTVSFTVTVASKSNHRYQGQGSGNAYYINGVESPFLTLTPGRTYRFVHDNTGSHPLKFYLEADKTTLYETNVNFQNTYTEITVTDETPIVLHYQCTNHQLMGNAVQANSNVVNTNYAAILRGGLDVTGHTELDNVSVSGFSTFTGAIDANGSLDVDGHAELDNVNVSGFSTFTGAIDANGSLDVDGHTELDNLNVSGVSTFAGNINANGNIVGDNSTNISGINSVTATKYFGDGSELSGVASGAADGQDFNTGITNSLTASLTGVGSTVLTLPATSGKQYIVYSIHAANVATGNTEVNVIGAFDFNGGERSYFGYNIPIPTGMAVEMLKQPHILNPSDKIVMRSTDYDRAGSNDIVEVNITYQEKTSSDYFGVGLGTVGIAVTTPVTVHTATTNPSIVESINLANRTDSGSYPVSILVTSGSSDKYLIDNLIVPKYGAIEILDAPKRLEVNDILKIEVDQTSTIDIQVSGKKVV